MREGEQRRWKEKEGRIEDREGNGARRQEEGPLLRGREGVKRRTKWERDEGRLEEEGRGSFNHMQNSHKQSSYCSTIQSLTVLL